MKNILNKTGFVIATMLSIPILLMFIVFPSLIDIGLSPVVDNTESTKVSKQLVTSKAVLGAEQIKINDVSFGITEKFSNEISHNVAEDSVEVNVVTVKGLKHYVYNDVIVLENNSNSWKKIQVQPDIKNIPSGTEFAITVGDVSKVMIATDKQIVPVQIELSPNEQLSIGFRVDSFNTIAYPLDFVLKFYVE